MTSHKMIYKFNYIRLVYIALIFFAFISNNPFDKHLRTEDIAETGDGNIARQIFLLFVAMISCLAILTRKKNITSVLKIIPPTFFILLLWCGITLIWSPVFDIGLRRLLQAAILIFSIFALVKLQGPVNSLRTLAISLLILVSISAVSAPFLPNGIHSAGERDVGLVGAWRGLFSHKNHAGIASSIAIILSLFFWRLDRKNFWLIGIILALALLFLSRSKTAAGLLIPILVIGLLAEAAAKGKINYTSVFFGSIVAILGTIILGTMFFDNFAQILDDPAALTGRIAIWATLANIISTNYIGGVGFASLYDVGSSNIISTHGDSWISLLSHGHNGYLDLLATTGVVGFLIAMYALVANPLFKLFSIPKLNPQIFAMLLSILLLAIFHNLLESTFLNRTAPIWLITLVIIASISQLHKDFSYFQSRKMKVRNL